MGAYLEFQDLVLGLFEQAGLEAYTVHDYVDTEQLGRRWDLVGGAVQPLWDILQASLKEGGAFDQLGLVREERTRSDGGGMESTVRMRLAAYPEPQDFCRDSFWAATAKVLSDTLDLLYRQFPEDSPAGPS